MQDIVIELQQLPSRHPPASSAAIEALAAALGYPIPEAVLALYRDHDGLPTGSPLPMRLLSTSEATSTNAALRQPNLELSSRIAVFWTDDDSNYAGVFTSGQLQGRVCLLEHDEPADWPKYQSVASLCRRLVSAWRAGLGWYDMPHDYPVLDSMDVLPEDRAIGLHLLDRYSQAPDTPASIRAAFGAMQLLPPADTELLLPLLRSTDMWVQERACQVLGLRKFAPAIEALSEVAMSGMHNGRAASLIALRQIDTPEATRRFDELRVALGKAFPRHVL